MKKYITLSAVLFALVSWAAWGQSSHDSRVLSDNLTWSQSGNAIEGDTVGTFNLTRPTAGTVTLRAQDNSDPTALTINSGTTGTLTVAPGGAGAMQIGLDTGTTLDITAGGAMTIGDDTATDSIALSTAGTLTLGSAGTDSITFTTDGPTLELDVISGYLEFTAGGVGGVPRFIGADDAGAANTIFDTTSTGNIDVGSPDVSTVELVANGGTFILQTGDVTLNPAASGTNVGPDQGATFANHNQFIGIPKLNVTQSGAALPDGTATAELVTPLIASCAPITAGTEAAGTYRVTGAASYQYTAQATAAENDGFDCDVTGHAVNGTDTAGFWIMTDTALSAGTLDMTLDDGGVAEANADLPAISVTDEWVWVEVDFGTDCDATCADIDGLFVQVTAAGAATDEMDGTVIHIDTGGFWLDGAEVAIGDVLVGGVISVSAAPTAAGSDNTPTELVEYTDYLVTYQSGADALVFITDQSANYGTTLEALQ